MDRDAGRERMKSPFSRRRWVGFVFLLAAGFGAPSPWAADSVSVVSPVPYAVFQRSVGNTARIPIQGSAGPGVAKIEAKATLAAGYREEIDGRSTDFRDIGSTGQSEFRGSLEVPAGGWYTVTIRALDAAGVEVGKASVEKVGVGEVFVAAGHSFCANSQGDTPGRAEEDRVATCVDWHWTNGPPEHLAFRHAADPMRPADARRASVWPAVGDVLVRQLHVPVLIISTGVGGSTVEGWRLVAEDPSLVDAAYKGCRETLRRWVPYTGLRAVVWFGNENDLKQGPTAEVFADNMRRLIARARIDSGIPDLPWIIAFDAYDPGVAKKIGATEMQRRKERIDRGAQAVLGSVPFTYDGPQSDDLGPEFRRVDGDHFNEAGVRELGVRFARHITRAFFPAPIPSPQAPRGVAP